MRPRPPERFRLAEFRRVAAPAFGLYGVVLYALWPATALPQDPWWRYPLVIGWWLLVAAVTAVTFKRKARPASPSAPAPHDRS